ncbi:MAG: hypothetical protein F4060_02540 [Holophagales bacterium]|nr:hypothetical protein [Holophagales bacterium]MYA08547.1 hypothetical protein [Holophagales bacterium]MYC11863.1 hypothetical protein [Holophagales bacterium]MYG30107.1 hypothetical protein [Holophagales bacterium]MYI78795.1 hypothetical protein [Holophagales bacterium]
MSAQARIDRLLAHCGDDPKRLESELIHAKLNLNRSRTRDGQSYWNRLYNALSNRIARLEQEGRA